MNEMSKMKVRFAYPLSIPHARVRHPRGVLFAGTRPYWPDHVYMQTTDADGMVVKRADDEWTSELECELTLLSPLPFAMQATIRVEGFGQLMCRADDEGRLYSEETAPPVLLFDVEAARTALSECERRIVHHRGRGIEIDPELLSGMETIRRELEEALTCASEHERMKRCNAVLGRAVRLGEEIEYRVALSELESKPKRPFAFNAFIDWNSEQGAAAFADRRLIDAYRNLCNSGVVSVFWKVVQPERRGSFRFDPIDRQVEFMQKNDLAIMGHCLGWLQLTPDWLKNDFSLGRFEDDVMDLARNVAGRYGQETRLWSICNEYHDWVFDVDVPYGKRLSVFRRMQDFIHGELGILTESDSCVVNSAWRMTRPEWSRGPWEWHSDLATSGAPEHVMGLQFYYGAAEYATFSQTVLMEQLEKYLSFGHPVHVYLQCPGGDEPNAWGEINGIWRAPWSEETQADWWSRMLVLLLNHPQVKAVTTVTLHDTPTGWMPLGGLCTPDFTPKKAYRETERILDRYTTREFGSRSYWGEV